MRESPVVQRFLVCTVRKNNIAHCKVAAHCCDSFAVVLLPVKDACLLWLRFPRVLVKCDSAS